MVVDMQGIDVWPEGGVLEGEPGNAPQAPKQHAANASITIMRRVGA